MKLKSDNISKWRSVLVIVCLSIGSNMEFATGEKDSNMDFSSDAFLKMELGEEDPFLNMTDAPSPMPSTSIAPTATAGPTGQPSKSLAPSATPTESPAPSPSPSAAPTMAPTKTETPTGNPTESPTESPAPSPSPSASPTLHPTTSSSPSSAPSVSSAPSGQPSASPTDAPSAMPSDQPSNAPTISTAPSDTPSISPTLYPSPSPSASPTDKPSDSPSDIPSDAPSISPSMAPSVSMSPTTSEPSTSPSASPTEVSFKTKSGITNVFLLDIDREMTDEALARFEVTTLEFIRDTQPATPGYSLDLLAVTVLVQEILFPEPEDDEETGKESNAANVGLQVEFRTVGVVTEGVAPSDFVFTSITDAGFEFHFGEYLYRLSIADRFFEPVSKHVDTTTLLPLPEQPKKSKDDEETKKGTFAAAVLFATVALIVALAASVYAVRRHLRKQSAKLPRLTYPGHGTKTMSEDRESADGQDRDAQYDIEVLSDLSATLAQPKHQTERVGPMQLDIDDEKIEMEEIGLTPMSLPSDYGTAYGFHSAKKPSRMSVSPSAMERGTTDNYMKQRVPFGFGVRKWLTPRQSPPKDNKAKIDLNDPPANNEINNNEMPAKKSRQSLDPDAFKASTRNASGVLTDEVTAKDELDTQSKASKPKRKSSFGIPLSKSRRESSFGGNGSFGVPVSFFGRSGDNRSEATSGNMDSAIGGSTASSFMNKMGRKHNVFSGKESDVTNEDHPNGKTSTYKFGSMSGTSKSKSGSSTSGTDLNQDNLAVLQTNSNENVEASVPSQEAPVTKISKFESKSLTGAPTFGSGILDSNKSVELVLEDRDDQDTSVLREVKRTQTFEVDSVYSEQSELDLNAFGVETTLGAVPTKYDDDDTPASRNDSSFIGHEYGSRPIPFFPSSSTGAPAVTSVKQHQNNGKQSFPFGARKMAAEEEKRRISLNTAIKQGDTYDVFAPAGPIGIVVDTSKMGPAVHSLKSTSPMLGLISAGDLIIALDDEDTRNMTAAQLTRLMAKKSKQKERKITLLAPDGF